MRKHRYLFDRSEASSSSTCVKQQVFSEPHISQTLSAQRSRAKFFHKRTLSLSLFTLSLKRSKVAQTSSFKNVTGAPERKEPVAVRELLAVFDTNRTARAAFGPKQQSDVDLRGDAKQLLSTSCGCVFTLSQRPGCKLIGTSDMLSLTIDSDRVFFFQVFKIASSLELNQQSHDLQSATNILHPLHSLESQV